MGRFVNGELQSGWTETHVTSSSHSLCATIFLRELLKHMKIAVIIPDVAAVTGSVYESKAVRLCQPAMLACLLLQLVFQRG
jgi:hypothetical protein